MTMQINTAIVKITDFAKATYVCPLNSLTNELRSTMANNWHIRIISRTKKLILRFRENDCSDAIASITPEINEYKNKKGYAGRTKHPWIDIR